MFTPGRPRRLRGAILVDVAIAVVIVGTAVVALMGAVQGATRSTFALNEHHRAVVIARTAQEWAASMPAADIETHFPAGNTYPKVLNPGLIDAHKDALTGHPAGWSQRLSLRRLNDVTLAVDPAGQLIELTATAHKQGASGQSEPVFRLTRIYSP